MRIIHSPGESGHADQSVCVAIGFFDGVHLGHQQILRQTVADARQHEATSLVITFDQHPNTIVAPARVPPLIYSLPQKLRTIETLGIELLWLAHFDQALSQTSGEDFVRGVMQAFGQIRSICVGANFVFGRNRSCNVELLSRLGAQLNFTVHGLAAVSLDGLAVSSTRIRGAVQGGELDQTSQMLGRSYSLAGKVVAGDRLGRTLGFPTANLEVAGLVLPPTGVYAAHALLPGGQSHRAVLNLGHRPTIGGAEAPLRVEAHLLDFHGELYDQTLELVLLAKLRDERKFDSLADLREQIGHDIKAAEHCF